MMNDDEALRKTRRKRCSDTLMSPFPVPVQSITNSRANDSRWYYYFGILKNDHVAVYRKGDLTYLYLLGYFGKGVLSKGQPKYENLYDVLSKQTTTDESISRMNLEVNDLSPALLTNIREERLRQHAKWSKENPSKIKDKPMESKTFEVTSIQEEDFELKGDFAQNITTDGEESDDSNDDCCQPMNSIGAKRSRSEQLVTQEVVTRKQLKLEDSYKLFEYLQLTFEEAFFLSYGLGCLSVDAENDRGMNIETMWMAYHMRDLCFHYKYVAYHHFRSKGWVVRFSNLFGADFVLYEEGMPFTHASYAVFVRYVDENGKVPNKNFSWNELTCICRLNEKIAKEVLICHIIKPNDMSEDDLMSPACVKRFRVMKVYKRYETERFAHVNLLYSQGKKEKLYDCMIV